MNFIDNTKISRIEDGAVAGVTVLTSDVIDMQNFDGLVFLAALGDVLDTGVNVLQAQHSDVGDGTGMNDITASVVSFTAGASDADNKLMLLEIFRPTKRFLRVTLTRSVANTVLDGIFAFQSNPAEAPVTQHSSVLVKDFQLSPV